MFYGADFDDTGLDLVDVGFGCGPALTSPELSAVNQARIDASRLLRRNGMWQRLEDLLGLAPAPIILEDARLERLRSATLGALMAAAHPLPELRSRGIPDTQAQAIVAALREPIALGGAG